MRLSTPALCALTMLALAALVAVTWYMPTCKVGDRVFYMGGVKQAGCGPVVQR